MDVQINQIKFSLFNICKYFHDIQTFIISYFMLVINICHFTNMLRPFVCDNEELVRRIWCFKMPYAICIHFILLYHIIKGDEILRCLKNPKNAKWVYSLVNFYSCKLYELSQAKRVVYIYKSAKNGKYLICKQCRSRWGQGSHLNFTSRSPGLLLF